MRSLSIGFVMSALLPLALAGCVSTEDQQGADQEKCASYGYRPGTDAFADCLMGQDWQRADDQRRTMESLERQDRRDRKRLEDLSSTAGTISQTPQYDRDGNPNFDAEGNYQGCHGIGCEVDNPDV